MTAISPPPRPRRNNIAPTNPQQHATPISPDAGSRPRDKPPRKKRAIYYPTGDGKPMAEDVLHRKLMAYCCDALGFHFAARPDVHVAGNDFLYYEEGNPKARVSPDCYVAMGVEPKPLRRFYKIWEESGIVPCVVIELTSKKTQKEDVTTKRPLYKQILRVQEYFQFNPTGDYLNPRLQGQRLVGGAYQPIELRDDRMTSEQLGLELAVEGETLRLYDPVKGEFLRTYEEAESQRIAQEQRADSETRRAEAALAELSRLRRELDALRRQQ